MYQKGIYKKISRVLIMGITFKENFNDIRNSMVPEIYKVLVKEGIEVEVYDPIADYELVKKEYGISLIKFPKKYEAIILAVPHQVFLGSSLDEYKKGKEA